MKRWQAVLLWFAVLFLFNLVTGYNDGGYGFAYAVLMVISRMTTPLQILLTVIVLVAIWKKVWERKSLAERMQEKAAQATLEDK